MGLLLIIGLIVLLYHFSNQNKKENKKYKSEWKSQWKWNEKTQMWEHPNGQKIKTQNTNNESAQETIDSTTQVTEDDEIPFDYSKQYQPKYLLTKNEWFQYKKLKEIADIKNLIICPKVRLLDIIEPRHDCPHYKGALGKISSKHVDFVICDQNLHIKAIIELDDNSHDTEKGKEKDRFVNQALSNAGYNVIRTRYINNDTLDLV